MTLNVDALSCLKVGALLQLQYCVFLANTLPCSRQTFVASPGEGTTARAQETRTRHDRIKGGTA